MTPIKLGLNSSIKFINTALRDLKKKPKTRTAGVFCNLLKSVNRKQQANRNFRTN